MDTNPTLQPPPAGGVVAGAKRSIAMALLAIGLLVVGGSAVALAADPSPSESPAATTTPTNGDDGPTTAPGTDSSGEARPSRGAHGDCPDDGSSGGSSGGDTSSDNGTTPDATTVPAPSLDPADV